MQNQDQPGESFDNNRFVGHRSEDSDVDEINVYELSEPFSSTSTASQQEPQQKLHPPTERAFVFRRYPVISIALVALVIAIIALPLCFIAFGAFGQSHSLSPTPEDLLRSTMSDTPAYADPLTNPSNPKTKSANWVQNTPNKCFFAHDGYRLQATGYSGCWESGDQFENLALSIDVTLLSGTSAGVYCRFGIGLFGGYYGYLLGIDSGGNYWIAGSATVSQQSRFSPAIKQGYHVNNTLEMIAQGTTFYFFVNGVFLTKLTDTNPTPAPNSAAPAASPVPTPPPPQPYAGEVAFLANPAGTEAVFSNLKVYALA